MNQPPRLTVVAGGTGSPKTADEGVRAWSPAGMETGQVATRTPNSPSADVPGGAAATASPGTTPYHMTPDEYDEIRAEIWCEPWKDPSLFPDLLHHLVRRLGDLAMRPLEELEAQCYPFPVQDDDAVSEWATDLLRECFRRARSGVPFDEPPHGDLGPTNPKDV